MPDPSRWIGRLGVFLACLTLYACATPRYPTAPPPGRPYPPPSRPYPPPERPRPPAPSPRVEIPTPEYRRVADLPGWAQDDHAAAFAAFQAGCRVTKDADLYVVCRRARAIGRLDEAAAKAFFQDNFRPRAVQGQGLMTGYFVPEYEAREDPAAPYIAPVRPRPADLPPGSGLYADRATIESVPADRALAWMKPEDLFFMQIQGSGVLDFPDGHRMKANFAATNGQPFTPIAVPLRQRGALTASGSSGDAVRAWLADHRGPEADAVMDLNARYVFFSMGPDDGREPAGTAGIPLPPGHAIAVDLNEHPMGGLFWLDAEEPSLTGAAPAYRRLAMALDTGGAIKGVVRADLYVGRGPAAGVEAGHIRHVLRMYELVPVDDRAP